MRKGGWGEKREREKKWSTTWQVTAPNCVKKCKEPGMWTSWVCLEWLHQDFERWLMPSLLERAPRTPELNDRSIFWLKYKFCASDFRIAWFRIGSAVTRWRKQESNISCFFSNLVRETPRRCGEYRRRAVRTAWPLYALQVLLTQCVAQSKPLRDLLILYLESSSSDSDLLLLE